MVGERMELYFIFYKIEGQMEYCFFFFLCGCKLSMIFRCNIILLVFKVFYVGFNMSALVGLFKTKTGPFFRFWLAIL